MKAVGRPQKWTKMWRGGRKYVGARYMIQNLSSFLSRLILNIFSLDCQRQKNLHLFDDLFFFIGEGLELVQEVLVCDFGVLVHAHLQTVEDGAEAGHLGGHDGTELGQKSDEVGEEIFSK